jgi:hypothetical protein
MKIIFKFILTALTLILFGTSCSESDPPEDFFVTNLTSGSRIITLYSHDGIENDVQIFDGYVFTFNTNKNVTMAKNSSFVNGHWEMTRSGYSTFLSLDFNGSSDFDGINRKWFIMEIY